MNIIPVGTQVQVQLGPNIETGTIEDGRFGEIKVRMPDGIIKVNRDKLVNYVAPVNEPKTEEPSPLPAVYAAVPETEEASAFVINDEWYGQIETANPFDEAAEPYIKANPGRKFRFLGPTTVKRHGKRGYQETINKATGKPVESNGMTLASIPIHVHEERARRVQQIT